MASPEAAVDGASEGSGGLLDLVLAATNDGVMDWDLSTGQVRYSERWKALLCYEEHELLDTPSLWREVTHPDDLAQVEALLREHLEHPWPFAHRWRMRHKGGVWRWSLCRAVTLRDERGSPVRWLGVFSDVTDQVLTEQGLEVLMRRNDLLLASAGEGFLGIDAHAKITFANPAAAQLLRRPIAELVDSPLSAVFEHGCVADQGCHATSCPVLRPFSGAGIQRVSHGTCGRSDGTSFAVDYASTPASAGDAVVGVVLTFRDVTEQRQLEGQRLQGQKLEAIGQLAAGIAHEINTPMQYIGDNVGFLEGSFADLLSLVNAY